MKKLISITLFSAVAIFFVAFSSHAQVKTVTSPTKYQTIQYPAKLKAQLPKTPEELKALMPKLPKPYQPPVPRLEVPPSVGKKVLIVLQENSGKLDYMPNSIPENEKAMIEAVIDTLAETFEDLKTSLQTVGKYDKVVLLTDNNCKRSKLLQNLVFYTKQGWTIDLLIMGHGNVEVLSLKDDYLTGRTQNNIGNIWTLLTDARRQGLSRLNLRLVYMCNCWGATTCNDWRAIGAKIAIGPQQVNVMPEPQITFFLHNWISGQKANEAARSSYDLSIPFYMLVYPPNSTVRFEKRRIQYICGAHWEPQGCVALSQRFGCWQPSYCTAVFEVPVGINLTPHPKIKGSVPIVDSTYDNLNKWTFHTVY